MSSLYFTSAPDQDEKFQVGDRIEVYCDHEIEGERIRDWLEGTVVQVDPKMLAVQFREKVYLTDGWMVPDHVLWCPKESHNIRHVMKKRRKPRPKPIRSGVKPAANKKRETTPPDDLDDNEPPDE